jgi:hypothetical protein
MEIIFAVSNLLVVPFWLLMIGLPHWRWTQRILQSPLVLVPLPLLYTVVALPQLPELLPVLVHPQLETVAAALGKPAVAAAGWIHYLAFDFFVGRYAYLDSRKRGIDAWPMVPVLVLTMFLGPVGLLLYLALRAFSKAPEEPPPAAFS